MDILRPKSSRFVSLKTFGVDGNINMPIVSDWGASLLPTLVPLANFRG